MARRRANQHQKRLAASLRPVATPDAEERLSRAIDILLRAAARGTTKSEDSPDVDKEKPSGRSTYETAGDEECNDGQKRHI